jgi:hypothetical protein
MDVFCNKGFFCQTVSFLSQVCDRASIPAGGKAMGGVKLITHVHLVPRLRIRGAMPPLLMHLDSVMLSYRLQTALSYLIFLFYLFICSLLYGAFSVTKIIYR